MAESEAGDVALDCAVCLSTKVAPAFWPGASCSHTFCRRCTFSILEKGSKHCPLCRGGLQSKTCAADVLAGRCNLVLDRELAELCREADPADYLSREAADSSLVEATIERRLREEREGVELMLFFMGRISLRRGQHIGFCLFEPRYVMMVRAHLHQPLLLYPQVICTPISAGSSERASPPTSALLAPQPAAVTSSVPPRLSAPPLLTPPHSPHDAHSSRPFPSESLLNPPPPPLLQVKNALSTHSRQFGIVTDGCGITPGASGRVATILFDRQRPDGSYDVVVQVGGPFSITSDVWEVAPPAAAASAAPLLFTRSHIEAGSVDDGSATDSDDSQPSSSASSPVAIRRSLVLAAAASSVAAAASSVASVAAAQLSRRSTSPRGASPGHSARGTSPSRSSGDIDDEAMGEAVAAPSPPSAAGDDSSAEAMVERARVRSEQSRAARSKAAMSALWSLQSLLRRAA